MGDRCRRDPQAIHLAITVPIQGHPFTVCSSHPITRTLLERGVSVQLVKPNNLSHQVIVVNTRLRRVVGRAGNTFPLSLIRLLLINTRRLI